MSCFTGCCGGIGSEKGDFLFGVESKKKRNKPKNEEDNIVDNNDNNYKLIVKSNNSNDTQTIKMEIIDALNLVYNLREDVGLKDTFIGGFYKKESDVCEKFIFKNDKDISSMRERQVSSLFPLFPEGNEKIEDVKKVFSFVQLLIKEKCIDEDLVENLIKNRLKKNNNLETNINEDDKKNFISFVWNENWMSFYMDNNMIADDKQRLLTRLFMVLMKDFIKNIPLTSKEKEGEGGKIKVFNEIVKRTKKEAGKMYEQLKSNLKSIQNCIKIIKQSTGKTNEDDITIKDIMQVLEKNCFSLDENTDVLLDVLKNGYIDKNDNDKRKFLNRYQVSLLLYYNKNLAKKIIDQKLSIIYNNNDPVEVILVDPENIQDDNNEINSNNTDNINKQNESLELFLQNSNITDKNDIKICNQTLGFGGLEIILFDYFGLHKNKPCKYAEHFFNFVDKSDNNKYNFNIMNYNSVPRPFPDVIPPPIFQSSSFNNAKNSLKILNKITKILSKNNNNIDNTRGLSFVVNSAGITNMIYELEKFEEIHENNVDNVFIDRINIRNVPMYIPTITMSPAETADRLIAVIKKLKDKGFIRTGKKIRIVLTSPDGEFFHQSTYSATFLTTFKKRLEEDNELKEFISFELNHLQSPYTKDILDINNNNNSMDLSSVVNADLNLNFINEQTIGEKRWKKIIETYKELYNKIQPINNNECQLQINNNECKSLDK